MLYFVNLVFILSLSLSFVEAAMPSKKTETFSKEDLKYIGCEVCEKMVAGLKNFLDDVRENTPKKVLSELQVMDALDYVCNPHNISGPGAVWIKKIDIVEKKVNGLPYLKLVEPGGTSKCGSECLTVAKSCQNMIDDELDADDLTSVFLKKTKFTVADLQKKICTNMSKRCKTPTKHMDIKSPRIDVPFKALTEKEIEMEAMMAKMKEMGLSSTMYGREDMDDLMAMGGMGGMGGDEDAFDEDMYGGSMGGMGGFGDGEFGGLGGAPYESDEEQKPFRKAGSKYEF